MIALDLIPRVWRERANPFIVNVATVADRNWLLWGGWLAATGAWAIGLVRRDYGKNGPAPWLTMVGVCGLATLASLEQFEIRPYLHYFLIGAPAAIVATVLAGWAAAERIRAAWPISAAVPFLYGALAVLPLLGGHQGPSSPFMWHAPPPHRLWRQDQDVRETSNRSLACSSQAKM